MRGQLSQLTTLYKCSVKLPQRERLSCVLIQLTTIPKCYKLFFVILLISKLFDLILCDWANVGGNLLFEATFYSCQ